MPLKWIYDEKYQWWENKFTFAKITWHFTECYKYRNGREITDSLLDEMWEKIECHRLNVGSSRDKWVKN